MPRQDDVQFALSQSALFLGSWWPVLVLAIILSICFIKPIGSRVVRVIQAVNKGIHERLFFPGAMLLLHHRTFDSDGLHFLRVLWFNVVFVSLIAGAFLAPPHLAFALAMLGSWLALSAGGYWVGAESLALEEDEEDDAAHTHVALAHEIQPTGVTALLLVLFFIPLSFKTADAAFDWYDSPDNTLHTWVFYSLHLLYQAAVDFGDVIQLEVSDVKPIALGGKVLVFGHFIGMTFLVLNGLTLVARREDAIRAWIRRLEGSGEIHGVRRFGARIWDDLLEVARCGDPARRPEAALRALANCEAPAPRRLRKSPMVTGMIALLESKPSEGSPNAFIPVRQAAATALGRWRQARSSTALVATLRDLTERREVRAEAALALANYGDVPGVNPALIRDVLLEVLSDSHHHAQIRVKAIDALIRLYDAAPAPDRVKQILNQLSLRSKEPDAVNARALHALRTLGLIDDEVERLMGLFTKLQSARIAERKEAALMLAEFGDHREVASRLIDAARREEDPLTRSCMVKSLSKIAMAGHHHDLLRPALLEAAAYERFETRRESLDGLGAMRFEGDVADRLCELACSKRSLVVTEKAKKILAAQDLKRMPRELATRCRAILNQPEEPDEDQDQEGPAELPLTAQEEAIVDSVVDVLREHPGLIAKLGGPEAVGERVADEVAEGLDLPKVPLPRPAEPVSGPA
jgi:hypothetical protein